MNKQTPKSFAAECVALQTKDGAYVNRIRQFEAVIEDQLHKLDFGLRNEPSSGIIVATDKALRVFKIEISQVDGPQ